MTTIGRVDDHVLLLQLERAVEALEDHVTKLADADDADKADIPNLVKRLDSTTLALYDANVLVAEVTDRVIELERSHNVLLKALERALLH
jgi:hypothetical protein